MQSNILQMQHENLVKMESASGAGTAGTSSAMSPPSSSVGGGSYFNLNSLIATPTSNANVHNVQSTSPNSSSIILATSVQNHHGIHGNLLFDSIATGGNTCPSSPTLLAPSSSHHLTHLTTHDHHNHHHYLHYHHPMHHHHHLSPHHHHLAMAPQGSLIMSSAAGSQSPGTSGSGAYEGQFQQSYLSSKMESPGSMETMNQAEHRLQEVGGQGSGGGGSGGPMMLGGNSYSM